MFDKFLQYVREQNLFERSHRLLLGISGGVDSVVLAHLIDKMGNEFAIAHCNFNLRGDESDGDESFVEKLADNLGVKYYHTSFKTKEIADLKGISIEMAARDLRYNWFEEIRTEIDYDYIVVGHHLDDVLETFILNLSRGTGIRGLSGIKPRNGKILRPLLFATRNDIEQYASENEMEHRFDKSNDDTTIKRNKVRHEILPELEKLNPSFKRNLQQTIAYMNDTETIFFEKIADVRNRVVTVEDGWTKLSIDELNQLSPLSTYLFELLRPFNFNADTVNDIIRELDGESGARFFSENHRLVIDREYLIVTPLVEKTQNKFYIEKNTHFIDEPIRMRFSIHRYTSDFKIPTTSDVVVLDYDKLRFPILIRKWQQGEYFKPLGMSGFKKVSDFFIDQKMSIPEKENTWILTSEEKVVWIVGRRLDDRYKITPDTKLVLRIDLIDLEID